MPNPLITPAFLEKWRRYVRPEVNEFSATSKWPSAQADNLELMRKVPQQCLDILDLGCGDGWSTNILKQAGKKAVGITISEAEAAHAKQNYGLDLIVRDMHDLPFADWSFDCIYCRESFEHTVAPFIAMCEMNRVLKPGGYLLMNVPWEGWIREDSHYSVLNTSQMHEMLYKCRFIVREEGRSSSGHYWYLASKGAEIGEPPISEPPLPGRPWLNGKAG